MKRMNRDTAGIEGGSWEMPITVERCGPIWPIAADHECQLGKRNRETVV